jgi:hypothetical protein
MRPAATGTEPFGVQHDHLVVADIGHDRVSVCA